MARSGVDPQRGLGPDRGQQARGAPTFGPGKNAEITYDFPGDTDRVQGQAVNVPRIAKDQGSVSIQQHDTKLRSTSSPSGGQPLEASRRASLNQLSRWILLCRWGPKSTCIERRLSPPSLCQPSLRRYSSARLATRLSTRSYCRTSTKRIKPRSNDQRMNPYMPMTTTALTHNRATSSLCRMDSRMMLTRCEPQMAMMDEK